METSVAADARGSRGSGTLARRGSRAGADYGFDDGEHAHQALDAHLRLISYDKEKAPWDVADVRELLELAEISSDAGKALLEKKRFGPAQRRYRRAGDCCRVLTMNAKLFADPFTGKVPDDAFGNAADRDKRKARRLEVAALANESLCYLKLGDFDGARAEAERAVDADPKHVKARFRLAAALAGLGQPRKAEAELMTCLEEEPYNKDARPPASVPGRDFSAASDGGGVALACRRGRRESQRRPRRSRSASPTSARACPRRRANFLWFFFSSSWITLGIRSRGRGRLAEDAP